MRQFIFKYIVFIFLLSSSTAFGGELTLEWVVEENLGEGSNQWATEIREDSMGNVVVTGWSDNGSAIGSNTVKYSKSGERLSGDFQEELGSDGISLSATKDGGSYIVTPEGLVIKYDENLDAQWSDNFVIDYFGDFAYAVDSEIGADGSIHVAIFGWKYTGVIYEHQVLVVKLKNDIDDTGDMVDWYDYRSGIPSHWSNKPVVKVDSSGSVYVSASDKVLKFNSIGENLLDFENLNDNSLDMAVNSDGDIYVIDLYFNIIKYDSLGQFAWEVSEPNLSALFIGLDSVGNVYAGGNGNSSATAKKYDSLTGEELGSADLLGKYYVWFKEAAVDLYGNVYMGGYHYDTSEMDYDVIGVKLTPADGTVESVFYDSSPLEMALSVTYDSRGSLYMTGYTSTWDSVGSRYLLSYLTLKYSSESGLCNTVNDLIELLGDLDIDHDGILNSLNSKLENALDKYIEGKNATAINILGAFINALEAQSGKKVDSDIADSLIENALSVIEGLESMI